MKKKRILIASVAVVALAGVASGVVVAKESREGIHDLASLALVKVTLPQAIATAEEQSNGRAISADIRRDNGATRIEVEVMGEKGTLLVMVDAQSGLVTATRAGEQDVQDPQDEQD